MLRKILSMCIAMLMVFTIIACGEEKSEEGQQNTKIENGFVFSGYGSDEPSVELGTPDKELDPEETYSKITYNAEMFCGDYSIVGKNAENSFAKEHSYVKYQIGEDECEITAVPYRMRTGEASMDHSVNYIKDHNWTELYFMRKYDENEFALDTMLCSYTIEGNKIIFTPLKNFHFDGENNKIDYAFADVKMEYEYKFKGRTITLTNGKESVTMTTGLDPYREYDYISVDNYLNPESDSIDGIDAINFRYDEEDQDSIIYFEMLDGEGSYTSKAILTEDGLFTFTLALEKSKKTYQYVYFCCGEDGIILTDGEKYYYYTDTYSERNKSNLSEYITEDQTGKLDKLTEAQLEAIVTKKENLLEDLAKAFEDEGINVTVDSKTGELAMDSSILFGGDSAALTDEGKTFLNKFVNIYTTIVFSEKYDGFVSKTMVEGHTAPVAGSTYESGLPLSEERAKNVKDYCTSAKTDVDTTKLIEALDAVGYSNSKPIKDANGNVDMAASRRVSFRFIINIE